MAIAIYLISRTSFWVLRFSWPLRIIWLSNVLECVKKRPIKIRFLKKKIWSKYTLGIVVSWYNLRNCNIWLFLWHLSPQSGPFYQFWSFLLILFSKTTQKKSKHYSGRAFLEVFGKCVGLGLSSSIQRPQKC